MNKQTMRMCYLGEMVYVDFEYHGAIRGAREIGSGIRLEPDEPANVELIDVRTCDESVYGFYSEEELDNLAHLILREIHSDPDED